MNALNDGKIIYPLSSNRVCQDRWKHLQQCKTFSGNNQIQRNKGDVVYPVAR